MSAFAALAQGIDRKLFCKKESTFDTLVAMAGTDAFGGPTLTFDPEAKDDEIQEANGSADSQGFVRGMESGKWKAQSYIKASAAGTAPDIGPMLEAAFGIETVVGATSVAYTLSQVNKPSLALCAHAGSEQQSVTGAWVEQLDITLPANDKPLFDFSGGFARYGMAHQVATTASASSGGATITVGVLDILAIRPGAMVTFPGHAGGYLVDTVNIAAHTFHIASNLTANVTSGDLVIPYSPTLTTAGTVLYGVDCGITIDAVTYGFAGGKVSIKTGKHGKDKEASALRPTGYINGKRTVEFEFSFYLEALTVGNLMGRGWNQGTSSVTMRVGSDVSGKRLKVTMPAARWKVRPNPIPNMDEHIVTLGGAAQQSSTPGDSIALLLD